MDKFSSSLTIIFIILLLHSSYYFHSAYFEISFKNDVQCPFLESNMKLTLLILLSVYDSCFSSFNEHEIQLSLSLLRRLSLKNCVVVTDNLDTDIFNIFKRVAQENILTGFMTVKTLGSSFKSNTFYNVMTGIAVKSNSIFWLKQLFHLVSKSLYLFFQRMCSNM